MNYLILWYNGIDTLKKVTLGKHFRATIKCGGIVKVEIKGCTIHEIWYYINCQGAPKKEVSAPPRHFRKE
jgi:hypothetical protein